MPPPATTSTTATATSTPSRTRAVILNADSLPTYEPATPAALTRAVRDGGEDLTPIKALELLDDKADVLRDVRLLVLPSARTVPLAAIGTIDRFLKSGGQLVACA